VGVETYHIEDPSELEEKWFIGKKKVGMTTGTSTPDWMITKVREAIEHIPERNYIEVDKGEENEEDLQLLGGEREEADQEVIVLDEEVKFEQMVDKDDLSREENEQSETEEVKTEKDTEFELSISEAEEGEMETEEELQEEVIQTGEDVEQAESVESGFLASGMEEEVETQEEPQGEVIEEGEEGETPPIVDYERTFKVFKEGEIIRGSIVQIGLEEVLVDIGYKSEGIVSINEFKTKSGDLEDCEVGEELDVMIVRVEDEEGNIILSKRRAEYEKAWQMLTEADIEDKVIEGAVDRVVKGGLIVDLGGISGFIPASQVSQRRESDLDKYIGETLRLKVIELDRGRNRIILSRRVVLEEDETRRRNELFASLEEGQMRKGVVKNLAGFGAFVDLGGIDGLIHISELSWGRIRHPSEKVSVGDEIEVKVLSVDEENGRISLSLKQMEPDPWSTAAEKYPVGSIIIGKVKNIVDFGAFIELEEGLEGLLPISEMSWTRRLNNPSEMISNRDTIKVVVLDVNQDRKRMSLGLKQIEPDPWMTVDEEFPVGSIIKGRIVRLVSFGAFVELKQGVEGLIHISQLSQERVEKPEEVVSIGQEVKAEVVKVYPAERRIDLSIKRVEQDDLKQDMLQYLPNKGKGDMKLGDLIGDLKDIIG